jgi:hypothetical protein
MMSLLSVILTIACIVWAWRAPTSGIIGWASVLWVVSALAWAQDLGTRPTRAGVNRWLFGEDGPRSLSDDEFATFQRHHVWFTWTFAAVDLSWALNFLRSLSALGLVVAALLTGRWVIAALTLPIFVVLGPVVSALNPKEYLAAAAAKGNQYAVAQMAILRTLCSYWGTREVRDRTEHVEREVQRFARERDAGRLTDAKFEAQRAKLERWLHDSARKFAAHS